MLMMVGCASSYSINQNSRNPSSTSSPFNPPLDLEQLAGKYTATSESFRVRNTITIEKNGDIRLVENSPYGKLECEGKASLEDNILTSNVNCKNKKSFQQKVYFSSLKNKDGSNLDQGVDFKGLKEFKASVESSLYGLSVELDFIKN